MHESPATVARPDRSPAPSAAEPAITGGAPGKARKEHHQFLTFTLAGESYALGIQDLKEIIEYGQVTPVPLVPSHIRGVINLRGAVVPVIDLRSRFGRGSSEVTKRTCIVIVEMSAAGIRHDFGLVVDTVNEVLEIPPSEIEPPPPFGTNISTDFIAGMGKLGGRFVILLELSRILSLDELTAAARLSAHEA